MMYVCLTHWPQGDVALNLTHWPLGDLNKKFRKVIFKLISVTDGWGISCKIALRWMPLDLTDDKSTLVQVMAWCHQATSHYLSQCWPRFTLPYGVTRPQWVYNLIFKLIQTSSLVFHSQIALRWMPQNTCDDNCQVNIGSGNGLVPSGNKPLPEPILTQIYITIWHH